MMTNQVGSVFLRVDISKQCWNYTKGTRGKGDKERYGRIMFNNRIEDAHRMAFRASKGEIPEGMMVCHTCDNTSCVNPSHLFLGNSRQNQWDHWKKCRPNKNVKLSRRKVINIRKLLAQDVKRSVIAKKYGVSYELIMGIHKGRLWAHAL